MAILISKCILRRTIHIYFRASSFINAEVQLEISTVSNVNSPYSVMYTFKEAGKEKNKNDQLRCQVVLMEIQIFGTE